MSFKKVISLNLILDTQNTLSLNLDVVLTTTEERGKIINRLKTVYYFFYFVPRHSLIQPMA